MKKSLAVFAAVLTAVFTLFLCAGFASAQEKGAPIALFQSADLDDWDFFLDDPALKKSDVWEFRDSGVLYCKGMPFGWLATKELYQNFRFTVEYRWPEGEKGSNSGIFLRITGDPCTLPCCVECQLKAGNAGDFFGFDGRKIVGSPDRSKSSPQEGRGNLFVVSGFERNEKPESEWNQLEIVCQEGTIIAVLNGRVVNWTLNGDAPAGKLGLQSEGGPIEFRSAILTPLP